MEPEEKNDYRVTMKDMTRYLWVKYQWVDVTSHADSDRVLLRSHERTPEEGADAARQWDLWSDTLGGAR